MKHRISILLLLLANFVSAISQGMSMIAIPWYFTQIESMKLFGWIYAITNILAFFWVPYSGLLTDRYDRRKILMVVMGVLGCIILGIGLVGEFIDGLPAVVVASVFVLTFLNYNIHYPTLYAFMQEMTEPKYYGKMASYIEIQGQMATISSGALAAFLLSGTSGGEIELFGVTLNGLPEIIPWRIHDIFIVDGLSYFLGLMVLFAIPYRQSQKKSKEVGTVVSRVKTGLDYLRAHPYVTIFGLASYAVFVTVLIQSFYLLAPYVSNHLNSGANVYAAGKMTYSIGALLAGVSIRYIFKKFHLTDSIILMTGFVAAAYLVFFSTTSVAVFYLLGILLGLSNSGIRIQRVTYLFSRVPNAIFGRVNSVFNMGNILMRVVFLSIFSLSVYQMENVIWAYITMSVFLLVALIILIKFRDRMILDQSERKDDA